MTLSNRLLMLVKAALFSLIVIGGMAGGLGITTYAMSKANELVVGHAHIGMISKDQAERMCVG